jgi:hypothetical protein
VENPCERTLAIVWSHRSWRCEYSQTPDGVRWLGLYFESEPALKRPVATIEEMRHLAKFWREGLEGLLPQILVSQMPAFRARRVLPDRRRVRRGGRRFTDQER